MELSGGQGRAVTKGGGCAVLALRTGEKEGGGGGKHVDDGRAVELICSQQLLHAETQQLAQQLAQQLIQLSRWLRGPVATFPSRRDALLEHANA